MWQCFTVMSDSTENSTQSVPERGDEVEHLLQGPGLHYSRGWILTSTTRGFPHFSTLVRDLWEMGPLTSPFVGWLLGPLPWMGAPLVLPPPSFALAFPRRDDPTSGNWVGYLTGFAPTHRILFSACDFWTLKWHQSSEFDPSIQPQATCSGSHHQPCQHCHFNCCLSDVEKGAILADFLKPNEPYPKLSHKLKWRL